MMDYYDPHRVHEVLAVLLIIVLLPAFLAAAAYIQTLSAFFNELKRREPEVWEKVGNPSLIDMLVLPFLRPRKYYSFLPVLRERAHQMPSDYKYARVAYRLLRAGLGLCLLMLVLISLIAFWMFYHGI